MAGFEPSLARRRRSIVALLCLAAVAAAGCGKKGPPVPPAPRGPLPPTAVEPRQVGPDVWVSFTLPDPRGPNPGQLPAQAELVRVDYPSEAAPPADPDAFRRRGRVVARLDVSRTSPHARLRLEDGDWAQRATEALGWTLRYGVRVRDVRGRLSPLVVARDLTIVTTRGAPRALSAEATGEGVRLRWEPPQEGGELGYNVYRTETGQVQSERPVNPQPMTETEYLDAAVRNGQSYEYFVRAALAAEAPFRESATSATVSVVAEDRKAPAPPKNLVAVQERLAVRLFWDPSPERDLLGYRVYRKAKDGSWQRVGPDPIDRPIHLDPDIQAGDHVVYRVTAVDRATPPNESEPSDEVELDVGTEPPETRGEGGG